MSYPSFYVITTKTFQILSRHMDSFRKTQDLYNQILVFYYNLYLDHFTEKQPGAMEALRTLERLTILGRDQKPVPVPIPWKGVPLYFRRAAINCAIGAARSYLSRNSQDSRTQTFSEPVTFYKGMYRDFQETSISLKIWDGNVWKWVHCRLRGNRVPENGTMMSPSLSLSRGEARLLIPWKSPVCDGRTAKERIQAGERICSAVFTGQDACIAGCILDAGGRMIHSFFLRGGAEYAHRRRLIVQKLEKSVHSGVSNGQPDMNKRHLNDLRNLNDFYSHSLSRKLVSLCAQYQAKILVIPQYDPDYSRLLLHASGKNSPLRLHALIREKLKYKAWKEGIVLIEEPPPQSRSLCAVCGGVLRLKGSEFSCENGHRGNRYLNMARNLGRKCQKSFGKPDA